MQIDEHDIAALERLDQVIVEQVDKYIFDNPARTWEFMAETELSLRELRAELIKTIREKRHFQYWGLR